MKIAVTARGIDLDAPLDARFGRAANFIVYDTETEQFEGIDNSLNLNAPQGAGIQAAQNVVRSGVAAVITGHCGPKAYQVLSAAGIALYNTDAPTVREALERYKRGELTASASADVEGHW